nr:hypothetical protein [Tanacetum cinerariifolium]
MGNEHLNTIPATKSDEFIKSRVENLVPNLIESEGENECDVPAGFTTFSNVLFDAEYDFDSSDDQSFSDKDLSEKIYSNPLFDEEIIHMKIDPHSFNAELLYDNSSPRPPEEFVSKNSNADVESFSLSPIPIKDSDSHMEEIDLSFNPDDPMPPGIEEDDDDSERDIPILKELLDNYSLSLPKIESFHFDIPSSYRPPAKPLDEKSPDLLPHHGLEAFQPSAECPMMINGKNTHILDVPLFYFYPLDQLRVIKAIHGVDGGLGRRPTIGARSCWSSIVQEVKNLRIQEMDECNDTADGISVDPLSDILSLTSPRDTCRFAAISKTFNKAADSDFVWGQFLPPDYRQLIARAVAPVDIISKKKLFMDLSRSHVLLDRGTLNELFGIVHRVFLAFTLVIKKVSLGLDHLDSEKGYVLDIVNVQKGVFGIICKIECKMGRNRGPQATSRERMISKNHSHSLETQTNVSSLPGSGAKI